ncbi:MAG TPA: nitrilase-related carbon-nitrogen hydrolase [Anaerolineales bacterium]|nr:nitrilase-related carbon-nitrogen hydrolase [Anaerolineales bacterium]
MKALRISLAQTHWTGERASTISTYRQLAETAAQRGTNLLCLPEFTLSPYFCSVKDPANYMWGEPLHAGDTDQVFGELARQHGMFIISSLMERDSQGVHWDTAILHNPQGQLAAFTRKVHIPQSAGYYEDYYYGGASEYPIHDVAGLPIAMPTCYDQWFPEMARICALNGAEFIFYPTAIGSEPDAPELDTMPIWQTVQRSHAIANGVYVAAANRTGQEGVRFYGSSFICDPTGKILAQASREQTEVITADLDPAVFEQWRYLFPLLRQRRPDSYGKLVASE